jgi:hypothetical protein
MKNGTFEELSPENREDIRGMVPHEHVVPRDELWAGPHLTPEHSNRVSLDP